MSSEYDYLLYNAWLECIVIAQWSMESMYTYMYILYIIYMYIYKYIHVYYIQYIYTCVWAEGVLR